MQEKKTTMALNETTDNELVAMAREAQAMTGAETAVVALAEDNGAMVHYADGVGKHADWVRGRRGASLGSGICGVAFQGYSPVLVCDTKGDNRVRQDHAELLGIKSALAAPVYHQNRLLGALLLFNKADGSPFDLSDEATLDNYARQVAPRLAEYLTHKAE